MEDFKREIINTVKFSKFTIMNEVQQRTGELPPVRETADLVESMADDAVEYAWDLVLPVEEELKYLTPHSVLSAIRDRAIEQIVDLLVWRYEDTGEFFES